MRFLLDTDWIVNFLKGGRTQLTLVGSPDLDQRIRPLHELASLAVVLNADISIAVRYAEVRSDLRAEGQLIPDNDLWIAATALAHDLTLVTRDRHFERVPGLKLYQQVR